MELHHGKHHNTYVANLNKALQTHAEASKTSDLPVVVAQQSAIKFNGGGHINHSLFWTNLTPANSPEASPSAAPQLLDTIKKQWGDLKAFQQNFNSILLAIQGSGWGWLVRLGANGPLALVTTKDQDIVGKDEVPIIGIDMWEHAYYLQVCGCHIFLCCRWSIS